MMFSLGFLCIFPFLSAIFHGMSGELVPGLIRSPSVRILCNGLHGHLLLSLRIPFCGLPGDVIMSSPMSTLHLLVFTA